MLMIKLKKVGRKNQRTFRVIVQEDREKLDGKNAEDLGWFNPHANQFKVNRVRADYWILNGAKPTDSAAKLLERVKNSEPTSYEVKVGRKRKKKDKGAAVAAAEATAPTEATEEVVPTLSQDFPEEQSRGSSTSEAEHGSEEVGIEEGKEG